MVYHELGRPEAKDFTTHALAKLKDTFEHLGLTVEMGRTSFYGEGHKIDFKFSVTLPEKVEAASNNVMKMYGVDFEVGHKFRHGGETYEVTGYNPRASKYPVKILRLSDSSSRKCGISMVTAGKAA
jgi:hypothetical protein